ncbi:hypothetical protein RvY_07419-2 [Ramazzottius varieornatus]|uniref:Receptor ligand binding region domain-containing protein n=1 Tax=Ramazzottius varieornatus TaxID=947166 RepID=A0A1D1V235_RAMVA|nr:hypothetical protein RvY_07419-2 [Ramazzottius varieornatus]
MALELFPLIYRGSIKYNDADQVNDEARQAFRSLIMAKRKPPVDIDTDSFANKVKYLAREKYNYTFRPLEDMDPTITAHYESVTVYAQDIAKMVTSESYSDFQGNVVADRIKQSSDYEGVSGTLHIGGDGERDIDMGLRGFKWEEGKFQLKSIPSTNLHKFIGMGMTDRGVCEHIIYEVCSKGTMTDILHNEMIKLDWSFKNSLIKDIVFVSQDTL